MSEYTAVYNLTGPEKDNLKRIIETNCNVPLFCHVADCFEDDGLDCLDIKYGRMD